MARLRAERSRLLVIDMQERLLPEIHGGAAVSARVAALASAADILGVPLLATEQYPKGLGPTIPALQAVVGPRRVEKLAFSAAAEPGVTAWLENDGAKRGATLVLCGVEAHVCVLQTAMALAEAGHAVALVADASGSRRPEDRALALERARDHAIAVVGAEMVLFEWLGEAGTPAFRRLHPVIKALAGA